ncbi:MAG: bacteriorhodopsin [Planctomycetota bacterium]|jgi:bacteriorhodopsin
MSSVKISYEKWLNFLYGPIFKVIGFFYRIYTANRARVENLKSNSLVATTFKTVTVLIFIAWITVWYFSDQTNQISLIEEVKQSIGPKATGTD